MKPARTFLRMIPSALLAFGVGACGALGPVSVAPNAGAPTAGPWLSWAAVEIPKAVPTATPEPVPVPPEGAVLAAEVYPTPEAPTGPLITMEIVEDVVVPTVTSDTSAPVYEGGKYILVSIGEQHLYAYDNGTLIYSFVASTGMNNSTRVGTFEILDKIPNAYGSTWDIWMPNWMGIYWSGSLENGIHALPILPNGGRLWSGYLGTPISYGCVVLGVDEAIQLYDWADVGTPVEIRW